MQNDGTEPQHGPVPSDTMESLRQEIDELDSALVSLLARRRRLVERVAQVKREQDLPVSHPAREENLISARRQQAVAVGLEADFVEDIFRILLRHSRVDQLGTLSRRSALPGAKVLIVGGLGSMGRFFSRWFVQSDYSVRILDKDDWDRAALLSEGIDLCLLAVPINITSEIATQIGPFLPKNCILADITSLKREPMRAMMEAHPGPVVGFHPLFGPSTTTMDRQIVVVNPGRLADKCQWLLDQLGMWGNVLVRTTPDEHDEVMGIVQALRHFATFTFGQFLHSRKAPIHRTLELSSPIYRLEMVMVGRLFAQDPSLYAEIVFATPERLELLKDYIRCMNQNVGMLENVEKLEFISRFREIAEWFGPFSEQAMRESSFVVEKLVHRL